jgi:flagellar basal body P-ring formation protein FlgA
LAYRYTEMCQRIDVRGLLLGIVFCLTLLADAQAAAIEKLENIRAAARAFATQEIGGADDNIEIKVGRLDPRLRLAACGEPLTTYFSPGSRTIGHTTVGVRCGGPKAWSLFVPLTIDRQVTVAVAVDQFPRGHIIGAADVNYELRSVAKLNGGQFAASDQLIGKITTRPITRGSAYTRNMVKAPRIVRRGERVVLALQTGGVAVRVSGTALRDGTLGERIPVRNLSSKRVIEGIVHEPGLILVGNARPRQ